MGGDAVVVGGGLGGLATAVALRDVGWAVQVVESRSSSKPSESISLWSNGTAALAALGAVTLPGLQVERMSVIDASARPLLDIDVGQITRRVGRPNLTLLRHDALEVLGSLFGADNICRNVTCVGVEPTPKGARVVLDDGNRLTADLVVGADGVHSRVRGSVWGDSDWYSGRATWQGVTRMPPTFPSPEMVLTLADGATFAGALPVSVDQLHWFIDWRSDSAERPCDPASVLDGITREWPEPFRHLPDLTSPDRLRFVPIYLRRPPRAWSRGRVVLVGDAAHAMGPALGQGANQAFIDALTLADCLRQAPDIEAGLARYERRRHVSTLLFWHMSQINLAFRSTSLFPLLRYAPSGIISRGFSRSVTPKGDLIR